MISQEQFAQRVFDNFDTLRDKIDNNHSELNGKVNNLCERMTKVESGFESHMDDLEKKDKNRTRNFTISLGLITIAFAFYEVVKSFVS